MDWLFGILLVGFIVVSVALVLIILVQRPQGGGLAAAFGGSSGGGTDTAFGGRTGDVLTITTVGAFVLYLAVAIGLNVISNLRVQGALNPPAVPEAEEKAVEGTVTDTPATGPAGIQPASVPGPTDTPATGPAGIQPSEVQLPEIPASSAPATAGEPAPGT